MNDPRVTYWETVVFGGVGRLPSNGGIDSNGSNASSRSTGNSIVDDGTVEELPRRGLWLGVNHRESRWMAVNMNFSRNEHHFEMMKFGSKIRLI